MHFLGRSNFAAAEADYAVQALGVAPVAQGHGIAEGKGVGRNAVAQNQRTAVNVALAGFEAAGTFVVESDYAEAGAEMLLVQAVLFGGKSGVEAVEEENAPAQVGAARLLGLLVAAAIARSKPLAYRKKFRFI